MSGKGDDLAKRFKAALDDEARARAREDEARRIREEEGARALAELFGQLEAFAGAVGHLACQRDDLGVTLRYGLRGVRIEAEGDTGDRARVVLEGWPSTTDHRLYREAALGDRWVLLYRKHGHEQRIPLFDQGLEDLMTEALGLPRLPAAPEREMSPRLAEAIAGRRDEPPLRVISRAPEPEDDAPAEGNAGAPAGKGPKPRRL